MTSLGIRVRETIEGCTWCRQFRDILYAKGEVVVEFPIFRNRLFDVAGNVDAHLYAGLCLSLPFIDVLSVHTQVVLVIGNASFHHSDRIKQSCFDAGVKLLYLPPLFPDFNSIEEFFAGLKAYIRKLGQRLKRIQIKGFMPSLDYLTGFSRGSVT